MLRKGDLNDRIARDNARRLEKEKQHQQAIHALREDQKEQFDKMEAQIQKERANWKEKEKKSEEEKIRS